MCFPFYFQSTDKDFSLIYGDTIELLPKIDYKFDMIFADPPYFLSNGGFTIQNGKKANVDKGSWDKAPTKEYMDNFNYEWLKSIRDKLTDTGTIWISGTMHNIFSVGQLLTALDYKILNIITWQKTNPPPNLSCRYFTHSTEYIIWARKYKNKPHYYNYALMKELNDNKQMTDVWRLSAIAPYEKTCGKHPTQKPLSLLIRLILASTTTDSLVLDPFTGSSTTGIAAHLLGRKFIGIDQEQDYLNISKERYLEIQSPQIKNKFLDNLSKNYPQKVFLNLFS